MALKYYIVYDENGYIQKTIACLPGDIQANSKGLFFIEGKEDSETHKVVNGVVVAKTKEEIRLKKELDDVEKLNFQKEDIRKVKDKLKSVHDKYPEVIELLIGIGILQSEVLEVLEEE